MEKILICQSITGNLQNEIYHCIISSLLEKEYEIEILTSQDVENGDDFEFNMIIAFDNNALNAVTNFTCNIPIIYVFDDIAKNLVWNCHRVIKNFVVGVPKYNLPSFLTLNKDYCLIPSLFNLKDIKNITSSKSNFEEFCLLFCVNDKVLISLVPEINKVTHYKTVVICGNFSLFRNLLNPSVHVIAENEVSVLEYISNSDVFVGEKSQAALAVYMCKPTLVVGQEGYGGVISLLNINIQTLNGFKGRIGGCLDEFIPVDLLFKDIDDCAQKMQSEMYHDRLLNVSNMLYDINLNNINIISNYIVKYLSEDKRKRKNDLLIWNDNFFITAISGNRYLITDANIYKHVAVLSGDEYHYVKQFNQPQTLKQVLGHTQILPTGVVEELVNELLNEHIIKTIDL